MSGSWTEDEDWGEEVLEGGIQSSEQPSPEDQALEAEAREILLKGIEKLSKRDRFVLISSDFEEKTAKEIGEELDITAVNVGTIKNRAKKRLKKILNEDYPDYVE